MKLKQPSPSKKYVQKYFLNENCKTYQFYCCKQCKFLNILSVSYKGEKDKRIICYVTLHFSKKYLKTKLKYIHNKDIYNITLILCILCYKSFYVTSINHKLDPTVQQQARYENFLPPKINNIKHKNVNFTEKLF